MLVVWGKDNERCVCGRLAMKCIKDGQQTVKDRRHRTKCAVTASFAAVYGNVKCHLDS